MARVNATDYECESDLLPPICAKCGAPAADRVPRTVRYLHDQQGALVAVLVFSLFFGLFFFPPVFLLIAAWYSQAIQVRVPMCADHQTDWDWRDRAMNLLVLPAWCAAVLAAEVCGLVLHAQGDPGGAAYFGVGPVALGLALLVENAVVLRGAVRLAKPDKDHVRLSGVHEEFVAALLEERARDRVSNPDRRAPRGDVRDDYDDEAS
jgi:hypothetical protein